MKENIPIFVLLAVWFFSQHPITAMPQNEADTASGTCAPKDCVYSEWTLWSECSDDCGENGTRKRERRMLSDEKCLSTCSQGLAETERCNVRCCPQNCVYSQWEPWLYCKCSEDMCDQVGIRYVCVRNRKKQVVEACGGYCDDVIVEERCGNPCCYRDCALGPWAEWSECQAPCEQPGVKFRKKRVIQEPECGGKRCDQTTDQRHCMGRCCPVDCVQGPWSAWSLCPATCGTSTVTRTRFMQRAACNGVQCEDNTVEQSKECEQYSNVDCKCYVCHHSMGMEIRLEVTNPPCPGQDHPNRQEKKARAPKAVETSAYQAVSPWAVWSECKLLNGKCGNGTRTRTRTVLVTPECKGQACPELHEDSACKGPCCVTDCSVSDWSAFGHCSTTCGEGKRNSTRKVLVKSSCGGKGCPEVIRFQPCVVQNTTDCLFTPWAQWSRCDNDCGKGQETRTRTLLTPAYCGGKCASMNSVEKRECESYDGKADCQIGIWGAWSECARDCDVGVTTRKRVIESNDACKGVPCSNYNLTESKGCHERCSQLCNQAVCTCRAGFTLQQDGVTCKRRSCGELKQIRYCGPRTVTFESCIYAQFECTNGTEFEDRCEATCPTKWVAKGSRTYATCLETGAWDSPSVFCGKPGKAPVNISVNTLKVSELLKEGQCFAELTTDDDPWDKHVYHIVKDESSNLKVKDDHLCCIKSFDFESFGLASWKTTVRSTDLDGLTVEKEFTFTLLNENDPPRSVSLTPDTVPENSRVGTVVGCLQGEDDDPGQLLSFYIVKSIDKLFELFQDENNKTCVRVSKSSDPRCLTEGGSWCQLNYEKKDHYYIAIMVRDNGVPPFASYFDVHISLSDVNEPISAISMRPLNIPESVDPGQPLAKLIATDEDKKQKHTFRIVDDVTGLFSTDGENLMASQTLDYEQDPSRQFLITLEVTDDGTPPMKTQKSLAFGVGDKNESPYNLMITGADNSDLGHLVLRENSNDTMIGTVSVYDPDAGDSITLTVSHPRFTLRNQRCAPLKGDVYNYCSAQLVNTEAVDFEMTPHLNLTVVAKDNNFHSVKEEFTVEVLDQNDPPTDIMVNGDNSSVVSVREHQPATRVGEILVVDQDRNDTHTIFLSGSASSASQFRVDKGQLFTTSVSSLDYESNSSLSLVITAIDHGHPGQTVVKTFTINITDINEKPSDVTLSSTKVVENSAAGTVVANLTTIDPDNKVTTHQNFTYRLLNDANGRFRVAGHQLLVSEVAGGCFSARCSLNHEVLPDLLVKIQSTDSGTPPLSVEAQVILSVTDANDPPANIRLSKNTVRENKPPGTLVGTIMADDEDVSEVLTFTLLNGSDVFTIQNSDRLVTARELNYESNTTFVLTVRVTDSGQPPATAESTVTVVVEDAPEPPVFHTPAVMTAVENELAGSVVGAVVVTDPDLTDHIDVMLHENTDSFYLGKPNCTTDSSGVTCNVTLMTSVVLEYETTNKYLLELTTSDGQGHSVVEMVTVNVQDTNDPPTDVLLDGAAVGEVRVEEGVTDVQWTMTVVEQDTGQQHNITISRQRGDHLTIQGTTLKVTRAFDHETEAESVVVLTVTDNGSPPRSLDKVVKVIVEDVNEPPSGLSISANKVAENSPGGTVVGQLLGTDPEKGQTLTYSLQDDAGQRFAIEGDTLVVKDNGKCGGNTQQPCRLNFEEQVTHKVKVMVTDNGSPRKHATYDLDIEVTDANDPPHDLSLSGHIVNETAVAGSVVGTLSVEDEDQGQKHTYTMLNDSAGLFAIGDNHTVVKATEQRLDVQQVYSIKVKAVDNGSPPAEAEKTFYLSISGVSEAPQVPSLTAQSPALLPEPDTLKVPENMVVNATVAMVSSVDQDPDSALTFTLLEDGDGKFGLGEPVNCEAKDKGTSCSVSLMLRSALDHESRKSHRLLVQVLDPDKMQATLPVTLVVTDVNEPPQSVVFVTGEIQAEENSGGLTLGSFSAVDPDDGDSHSYVITADHGNKFTLSPTGLLATAKGAGLDYEQEQQHPVSIQVRDSAGNTLTQDFNVTVIDVNEKPASLTLEPNNTIAEMSRADSVIGRLTVSDPDNEGTGGEVQTFAFSILSDNGDRFYIDGDKLRVKDIGDSCTLIGGAACLLDYETKPVHNVIVTVTDSGSPPITVSLVVTVHVLDANDHPSPPILDTRTVSEAAAVGSVIGNLSCTDQDKGQTIRYNVVGESATLFSVNGSQIILAAKLDHEDKKEVKVTVRATDDGTPPLSGEETMTIMVEDVNEAPTKVTMVTKQGGAGADFAADQPIIMEDTERGATVAQLVVTDPDLSDEMTVLLSDPVIGVGSMSCLSLTKGSRCVGDVTLERALNYEEQTVWSVDVTAVDGGGLKIQKTFNITVGDRNDPPQDLLINGKTVSSISVPENSQDVTVATLSAVDPDQNQEHSFTVEGTTLFYTAGDSLKVTSAASLDFEGKSEYKVKVKVTDSGTPPLSFEKDLVIHVTDVNEAATDVKLSINQLDEDSKAGTVVGHFVTSDPDNVNTVTQTHTYTLTDDAEGRFAVNGENLVVKEPKFDYETWPSHAITGQVTDSGTPPHTTTFTLTIEVLDANDPPFNLRLNASSISEDTAVGSVVGELAADDVDKDQTLRYSIARNSLFVVSGNRILVDGSLDFETSSRIPLEIHVTDTGIPPRSISKTFSVEITDVNEEPSTVNLTSLMPKGALEISEKTKVDDVIGLLTTYDPDGVDFVTLSVTSRSDPKLKLEGKGTVCEQEDNKGVVHTKCTVHVLLAKEVNYEDSKEPLRLEVKAVDKGGLGKTEGWTFQVIDSNDAPTTILIEGNTTEIPENQESFVIGELLCSDPDPGDSHTFQLLTGWDVFHVAPGGVLTVARPLDYERTRRYDVMVRCADSGQPTMSVTQVLSFAVKNLNEKPTNISLSHLEVAMTATKHSIVGFVDVVDPDNVGFVDVRQRHTCTLDDGQEVFYVDAGRNTLMVKDKIPASEKSVNITMTCTDNGSPPLSVSNQFTLVVVETADVPKEVRLLNVHTVKENEPPKVVGELTVVNLLTGAPVSGTFACSDLAVNETKEAVLAIEGTNLVTKQPLDFEVHPFLTVTLSCAGRDLKDNEISVAGELKIAVVDVNEPPSEIRVYGGGWVDENSPSDTLVTRLNTVDPEPYQNYTYSILGVAAGLDPTATDPALLDVFTVEGRALKVGERAELLNHEATPLFSLTIRSTDDGTPPLSVNATVTVEVKDVNEPPTSVALDSDQVAENSAVDTVVGHLAVSDEDKGQQHTCQVTNLEDVPFTVKNKLDLVVSRADIDYEKARTYVVKVSCQDEGGDDTHLRVTSSLTINVTDVNEAPYDVRLSKESVPENSPAGQVVGEIMATDPDSHKVTFSLESGSDHFKIDGDNTLTAVSTFNYEELTTVPVSIRATDDQGLHTVKDFLIQIEDMNDPPSNLSLSDHVVSESTPPGDQVAQLITEDPDRDQTFTFVLTPDPNVDGHLVVSGNKLIVGTLGLDYENSAFFHIKITAVDSGTPPLKITKEFNLTVTDANEAPTDIVTRPIPPIQENVTVPHVLTSLYVIDQEREQRHSCNLVGPNGPLAVETDEDGNMTLVVQAHLDYETAQRYDVTLSCSDGQYDVEKNVSVQVVDVNEPPTLLTLSGPQALPASITGQYEVGRLTVTDQDLGQSHTLVLNGPNSDILTVRSDNTLVLTKAVPLSVLATPTPQVTFAIIATDNGRPPLSLQQHFTLPVTDVDVRQLQLPRITLSNGVVSEDAVRGTEVGALYDLNTTLSDTVVFTLVKDDENLFEIKDDRMLVLSRNMSSFTGRSAEVTLQARNTRTGEKVKRTITVLVKRSDKCYLDGRTCDENARCVALNDTVSQCQCDQDFKGDGYTCDEVNDCVGQDGSSPCQHGECVDGIQDFRCVCRHGYSGPRCEMEQGKADPCTSNPCSNGAACQPDVTNTTFTCTCRAGWEGQRCAKSVDDCLTGRCHGAGSTCEDEHLTFLCRCSDDRHGPRCEYLKAACPKNTCGETEVCAPVPDQAEHTCAPALVIVVIVIDCRKHGITDQQLCEMRFLDFVRTYGRFPENSKSPPPAKKQTALRMKRAASGAPYTPGVHVYRVGSTSTSDGQLNVSLLALDVDNLVFSKEEVLTALHATCHSIRSDQLIEGVFCPAIDQAYRAEVKKLNPAEGGDGGGGGEGEGGGLPIGIIGGAGGGGVVIIIIIVVVVVVIKKKKKNTDGTTNQHQSMENLSPSKQHVEHLDYDLNRVGESSATSPSSTFTPEGSKAAPDHKATPGEETNPKTLAL